jgi:hypothetical protein
MFLVPSVRNFYSGKINLGCFPKNIQEIFTAIQGQFQYYFWKT